MEKRVYLEDIQDTVLNYKLFPKEHVNVNFPSLILVSNFLPTW